MLFVLRKEKRTCVWVLKIESDGKKKEKMGYRKGEARKRRKREKVKQGETPKLARGPLTSTCARVDIETKLKKKKKKLCVCFLCFALCFYFLSFEFFGANKRGREWRGREEERTVCLGIGGE